MDSSDKLCCFGIIVVFIVIALSIFFLFGGSGSEDTTPINFVATANVVAKDVDVELEEVDEPKQTKFYVHSEDATKYYGRWESGNAETRWYNIKFTVDLDDINWDVRPLDSDYENYYKIMEAYEKPDDYEFNETDVTNFVKDVMKNYTSFYNKYKKGNNNLTVHSPILLNGSDDKLVFSSLKTYSSFSEGTKESYEVDIWNKTGNYAIELHIVVPLDSIESFDKNDPYGDSYVIVK